MEIKKYIDKIVEEGTDEDMEKLSDIMIDLIYDLKRYDEEKAHKYKMELYEMAYGKVLTKEMAEEIVSKMKPFGEYWDFETTTVVKNKVGIKDISDIDFYVVMNSKYNDNKDTVESFVDTDEKQLEMYISLTKDFVLDTDAKEGKVYTYFMEIPINS